MAKTCYDAFTYARAERLKHQLHRGNYKLAETRRLIRDWQVLIITIAERIYIGGKFGANESLGPCVAHERGTYLKSMPVELASLIGYKILPAIAALEGDGVPKAEVQRLIRRAEADAQRLLADCESVRCRPQTGIAHEYRAMRRGRNHLMGLLDAAADLVDVLPSPAQV